MSADAETVRQLYPDDTRLQRMRDEDRVVISEPMSELPGVWTEIPESTVLLVQPGADEQRAFRPHFEAAAVS